MTDRQAKSFTLFGPMIPTAVLWDVCSSDPTVRLLLGRGYRIDTWDNRIIFAPRIIHVRMTHPMREAMIVAVQKPMWMPS